jgi:hypothetical protein
MSARLYFDADGVSYRVHDVRFADGINKRLPLGDPSANYRVFVPESGPRRMHQFKRGDDHGVREVLLARQLATAGYEHTGKKFDGSEFTPEKPRQ